MCGIVGYVGEHDASEVLISGLSKLEYRGYDSAGIAVLSDTEKSGGQAILQIRRSVGKLRFLSERIQQEPVNGSVGIGHTR